MNLNQSIIELIAFFSSFLLSLHDDQHHLIFTKIKLKQHIVEI